MRLMRGSVIVLAALAGMSGSVAAVAASHSDHRVQLVRFGNPSGHFPVPPAGRAANTTHPNHVIGHGTPASCTSAAVVRAVAAGGIIKFSCGPKPVTILMRTTAVVPKTRHLVVLDGGGLVTLSGGGQRRILFSDTCQGKWSTSDCVNQPYPEDRGAEHHLRPRVQRHPPGQVHRQRAALLVRRRERRRRHLRRRRPVQGRELALHRQPLLPSTAPTSAAAPSGYSRSTRTGRSTSPATRSPAAAAPTARRSAASASSGP